MTTKLQLINIIIKHRYFDYITFRYTHLKLHNILVKTQGVVKYYNSTHTHAVTKKGGIEIRIFDILRSVDSIHTVN